MKNQNKNDKMNAQGHQEGQAAATTPGAKKVGQPARDESTQQRSYVHGTIDGQMPDPKSDPSQQSSIDDDEE